jgi:multicomponent Na+:H+ antiporter subunit D
MGGLGAGPDAVTAGGFLLVLSIVVPVAGALLAVAAGGRHVERIALMALVLGLGVALAVAGELIGGTPPVYHLGGWAPPLGVSLRADWLSGLMMVTTAVVLGAVALAARTEFGTPDGVSEARAPFAFWILLLGIWSGLNTVFVSGDLFTLYVALELLTFAAVPLVSLDGRVETLRAALRYLLFALLGSMLYLGGTALLYGAYGTLDTVLLSRVVRADTATVVAAALMTAGLLAKTALVPLHLWLPPAHAGAPAPASAVLSALVVKGSFFIVVRLWFFIMPALPGPPAARLLGALGAVAIVFGSVLALRQERLKLMVAYSTLAQLGYLFLMFPLAVDPASGHLVRGGALTAGMVQTVSHATAKAAMFLAAGAIYAGLGHDRVAGLAGAARALPVPVLAFVLGGIALTGVPPSGASIAKKLMLDAAATTDQRVWALVLQAGGFFTAGYVLLVLGHALSPAAAPVAVRPAGSRVGHAAALGLALCSLLLGMGALGPLLPRAALSNPFAPAELGSTVLLAGGGVLLALGLGRQAPRRWSGVLGDRLRSMGGPLGAACERVDGVLRQWPVACAALLGLVVLLGGLIGLAAPAAGSSSASAIRARTYGKNGFDSMRSDEPGVTTSVPSSPRAVSVPSWMPASSRGSGVEP